MPNPSFSFKAMNKGSRSKQYHVYAGVVYHGPTKFDITDFDFLRGKIWWNRFQLKKILKTELLQYLNYS